MEIGYLHLKQPIHGKKKVLDESSFIHLYLDTKDTLKEISNKYNINQSLLSGSLVYWSHKYKSDIDKRKSESYSRAGYSRPVRTYPDRISVDKTKLILLIEEGKTEWAIAKELGLAPQTLRKKIRKYQLALHTDRVRISNGDFERMAWLEQLVPGLIESSYTGASNPIQFFRLLYNAFVEVLKMLWFIQKLSNKHKHYRTIGKMPKDYISWRVNRHEILVSERLRELGIDHIRDYPWSTQYGRNFMADVYVQSKNLVVEIDGDIHGLDVVKVRDLDKYALMDKAGINYLRFTTKEVDKSLEEVIKKILEYGE